MIHTLFNIKSKETFVGTQTEFYEKIKHLKTVKLNLAPGIRASDYWVVIKSVEEPIETIHENVVEPITHFDPEIFTFENKNGDKFTGSKDAFIFKYKLNKGSVTKLINGTIKTTKNWKKA